jgi:hypothetical protein
MENTITDINIDMIGRRDRHMLIQIIMCTLSVQTVCQLI